MSPLVELESVTFSYRRHGVLFDDVDHAFDGGRAHAITGPSGCGKSTLLYLAGLMLRPSVGQVRLLGVDYASSTDAERARARSHLIGFVFQDSLLDAALTVWENIIEGLPWDHRRRRHLTNCADGLERLGLSHLRDRRCALLSGGQAQRVALVRATSKRPAILLADEPTGNLDAVAAGQVVDELVTYARDPERVTLIVTHDPQVASRCDNTVSLASPSSVAT